MKIAISQQNYVLGDFDYNFEKIISSINKAKSLNADMIVFSELAISGYPSTDFIFTNDFQTNNYRIVEELKKLSDNIGILIGSFTKNNKKEGKNLFNSSIFLYENEIKHTYNKSLLPTYDVFDEYRYFESAKENICIQFKNKTIAITICEDIWDIDIEDPLYDFNPLSNLIKENPDFIINLSASPFSFDHIRERKEIIKKNCIQYNLPLVYCNSIGAQTDIIFDGGSVVYNSKGILCEELKYFEEDFKLINIDNLIEIDDTNYSKYQLIEKAIVLGIKDFFEKQNFKKAILGLSGGIDSALTLVLATKALGSENVLSILMPSQYSSSSSVEDSIALCKNLNSDYKIINIENIYNTSIDNLNQYFEDKSFDLTNENLQSRIRGMILMAYCNKEKYLLLNTTNKSELAVGYGTLYGDLNGAISVLGDVLKTEVYELANYINKDCFTIPQNIITKAPSAELRPNQKDSDSLPEYDVLDDILNLYIIKQYSRTYIENKIGDKKLVERVLNLIKNSEFKRNQCAPIIRVSSKSFGIGRRMPIVGNFK